MSYNSTAVAVPFEPERAGLSDYQTEPAKDVAQAPDTSLARFSVRSVREPSVLPRLLEMFVLRDIVPRSVLCRDCTAVSGQMLVELVAETLTDVQAATIAARMLNLVPVIDVTLDYEGA